MELTASSIDEITKNYSDAMTVKNSAVTNVLKNEEFGFARLTIEQPLRRVWIADEKTINSDNESLLTRLAPIKGHKYGTENEAKEALNDCGLTLKEITSALKLMATTDPNAAPVIGKKSNVEPDPNLRDNENIPIPSGYIQLSEDNRIKIVSEEAEKHLKREINQFIPDAWIDHNKTKIGYEIPFTRQFYKYLPPRNVEEISEQMLVIESEIQDLLGRLK
jgi:type I restriction enzyme M protein